MVSPGRDDGAGLTVTPDDSLQIRLLGDAGIWVGQERLQFLTHRAELGVYCLALAGPAGLHQEVLAERLWPGAPADRGQGRLRTLLWQVRSVFGAEAWRVQRRARRVLLVLDGARVDVVEARDQAEALLAQVSFDSEAARSVVVVLAQPLLVGWQFESWVETEQEHNTLLVAALNRRLAHGR